MNHKKKESKGEPSKKELVLGKPNTFVFPYKWVVILVVFAVVAGGGYAFWMSNSLLPVSPSPRQAPLPSVSNEISYPRSLFEDGQAHRFEFPIDGLTVRYFVLKSSDGVVRAAFDACDVCWEAGKGYHQQGDVMVCGNCGQQFATVRINEVRGGCNPAPLARTERGDQIVIRVEDIVQGRSYFNLAARG